MSSHIPACHPVPLGKKADGYLTTQNPAEYDEIFFPKAVTIAFSSSFVAASAAPILCFNILSLPIP